MESEWLEFRDCCEHLLTPPTRHFAMPARVDEVATLLYLLNRIDKGLSTCMVGDMHLGSRLKVLLSSLIEIFEKNHSCYKAGRSW